MGRAAIGTLFHDARLTESFDLSAYRDSSLLILELLRHPSSGAPENRRHSCCCVIGRMTAYVFSIRTPDTDRLVGQAVLCPPARYASVLWRGATRPHRRLAALDRWLTIERQVSGNLQAGSLAGDSAIALLLLCGTNDYAVQYLCEEPLPVTNGASDELLELLDARAVQALPQ